ncbi:MAG: NAD-dependent protein deacylase [Bacteroidetes bacterium]|nr:NAD-dependent protein deacylase [Bacteroidota bacterium]
MDQSLLQQAAALIKGSDFTIAFTGAGISVESGVPPFRGEHGIWSKYDPRTLELGYFYEYPYESWLVIRELFYNFFGNAKANPAHHALSAMEKKGFLKSIITQNIDNLHQQAGSSEVYEFHGNSQKLICLQCNNHFIPADIDFDNLPPRCSCGGLIKPDFIFFGENIPMEAYHRSVEAAGRADVVIVIGSTGEVMPAAQMPYLAKQNGATIIEVNPGTSKFTPVITDIHLQDKAGDTMESLYETLTGEKLIIIPT